VDKFKTTLPFLRAEEQRPAPVPILQSETAEKILRHVWIPLAVMIGSLPITIGVVAITRNMTFLNIVPICFIIAGAMAMIIALREFLHTIDLHPLQMWLDMLDRRRDNKVFGVPIADDFTDDSPTEVDRERKVRRAIIAVVAQGVSAARDSIHRDHKIMSQREWYFWHLRMIRSGIIDENNRVLVASVPDANARWDKLVTVSRPKNSVQMLNIGEGKKVAAVVFSDLLNDVYVR
jgi:hypothetical protein